MATTEKAADTEYGKEAPPAAAPPPPPKPSGTTIPPIVDVALRALVFAATLTSLLVFVTSKQTIHLGPRSMEAKFDHSPAFIYFVVALSVAGLYSLLTTLASISIIQKPAFSNTFLLYFAFWDVLILGLVASATGAAGSVAYIGLRGNKHVQWQKVCNVFDKYCRHIGGSLAVSLFASVLLVLLIWLSVLTIHKRIPK
ncbi:hypothetical protein FNV43_RR00791 [Rhamnella rubrinervis]|uniref:CASP-like protein n=1 Tax=Rhamnella rubrinervis TaxID=2594499 RepID=A0A8K0MRG7_9ROSA|nr:hypothetical protein FNV43_RR00791 [Rhamnella rubrinervis]